MKKEIKKRRYNHLIQPTGNRLVQFLIQPLARRLITPLAAQNRGKIWRGEKR